MTDEEPPTEKERFTTTLDGELLQKIKILAIYEKCSTNILLEEAIEDLLRKYDDRKAKEAQRKVDQGQLFKND
jgi:predicted transcriptional regulator